MPVLDNPKHERFAQELAKGTPKQDAARTAGFSGKYVHSVASRLVKKSQIVARIEELHERVAVRSEYSQAKVLERLIEIVELKASDFDKPRSEWTEAMNRWACDQEDISERSNDGV